jgi:Cation transporter/ATPase, N-terminus
VWQSPSPVAGKAPPRRRWRRRRPPWGAAEDALAQVGSAPEGLAEDEAAWRLRAVGPNAVRSHRARAWPVLMSQLRSPLLLLLAVTVLASAFLGQASDAVIIGIIPGAVPLRLVRGIAGHPDPGDLRDPHPAAPVLPQHPPSMQLLLAALGVVTIGAVLPFTPLAHLLASSPCPPRSSSPWPGWSSPT